MWKNIREAVLITEAILSSPVRFICVNSCWKQTSHNATAVRVSSAEKNGVQRFLCFLKDGAPPIFVEASDIFKRWLLKGEILGRGPQDLLTCHLLIVGFEGRRLNFPLVLREEGWIFHHDLHARTMGLCRFFCWRAPKCNGSFLKIPPRSWKRGRINETCGNFWEIANFVHNNYISTCRYKYNTWVNAFRTFKYKCTCNKLLHFILKNYINVLQSNVLLFSKIPNLWDFKNKEFDIADIHKINI